MLNNISTQDGYTEDGYLSEVPGIHEALRFTYRPMLLEERDVIDGRRGQIDAFSFAQLCVKHIKMRLRTWDNKGAPDADGVRQVLPLTEENVRTLRPHLSDKLYLIVTGSRASDQDPEKPQPIASGEAELQRILSGESPAQTREGTDAKN
jgi:hypothetical protein